MLPTQAHHKRRGPLGLADRGSYYASPSYLLALCVSAGLKACDLADSPDPFPDHIQRAGMVRKLPVNVGFHRSAKDVRVRDAHL